MDRSAEIPAPITKPGPRSTDATASACHSRSSAASPASNSPRHRASRLPFFAAAIANRVLDQTATETRLIKGAALAVAERDDRRPEARQLWQEAAVQGAEIEQLLPFLDQDYDLLKDIKP